MQAIVSLMLTPAQCRAARALLDWTQGRLSEVTGLSAVTIRAFEAGRDARESNRRLLRLAFEREGIEFLDGDAPGVRHRPHA